jgi:hypothetical protein
LNFGNHPAADRSRRRATTKTCPLLLGNFQIAGASDVFVKRRMTGCHKMELSLPAMGEKPDCHVALATPLY